MPNRREGAGPRLRDRIRQLAPGLAAMGWAPTAVVTASGMLFLWTQLRA
ncbi:MAG TPA: hypothetical protein VLW53_04215 [Candidatus Eisenbacteria bacterium]|nr:hypothetical protein [Candidatus Eisenbacteria bacterium]